MSDKIYLKLQDGSSTEHSIILYFIHWEEGLTFPTFYFPNERLRWSEITMIMEKWSFSVHKLNCSNDSITTFVWIQNNRISLKWLDIRNFILYFSNLHVFLFRKILNKNSRLKMLDNDDEDVVKTKRRTSQRYVRINKYHATISMIVNCSLFFKLFP